MLIQVKQSHIESGGGNCRRCPIALAIREELKIAAEDGVMVLYDKLVINKKKYDVPPELIDKMTTWDRSETMEPFQFELVLDKKKGRFED